MRQTVVAVGMSGGVDSSVAAALLVEQGYSVIGIMLRLWSEPGQEDSNRCCTPDAMAQARRVAAKLGIPFYALNAQKKFHDIVVQNFIEGYSSSLTPNPCLDCNQFIRWGHLMRFAEDLGATKFATGHYARLRSINGNTFLLRAKDDQKDQSYVLSVLPQEKLQKTILPVGEYTKTEVREIAHRFGLSVAERQESQDLCFLAGKDYRQFLQRHTTKVVEPGKIENSKGEVLGEHQGLGFYTIGQRKGLGLSTSRPMYVIEKRAQDNLLVVGEGHELGNNYLLAHLATWIGREPPTPQFRAEVKIRYKATFAPGLINVLDKDRFEVKFDYVARDITPGQRVVIYDGEFVVGGGTIQSSKNLG